MNENKNDPDKQPIKAAEIAREIKLGGEARQLLNDRQTAAEYLALLDRERLYPDALRFAAYSLSKREAVWWGCLCLWQVYRPRPTVRQEEALKAALAWVQEPSEENRRSADAASQVTGQDTPAGGLALAAFYSGGSISLPGLPSVAPKPFLTAKTVAGVVLLASCQISPDQIAQCQRQFLALAADVAEGRSRWQPAPAEQ